MNVTPDIKTLIEHIVNVFETGSPTGDYGEVSIYHDGNDGSIQITYGRSQTTEQGNLRDLVQHYIQLGGKYAADFSPYVNRIGSRPTSPGLWPTLARDAHFINLLKAAGSDPIMHAAEEIFFDHDYFQPALDWANFYHFTLPLSMLVIYDSFIHSGSVPYFLRSRFSEAIPRHDGDETRWITEYVNARNEWLRNYSDPAHPEKAALLRTSAYRTQSLLHQIAIGNWDLHIRPIRAHDVDVLA